MSPSLRSSTSSYPDRELLQSPPTSAIFRLSINITPMLRRMADERGRTCSLKHVHALDRFNEPTDPTATGRDRAQSDGPYSLKQVHVVARHWESNDEFKCRRKDEGMSWDRGMCSHKPVHALERRAERTRIKEVFAQTSSCCQSLHR